MDGWIETLVKDKTIFLKSINIIERKDMDLYDMWKTCVYLQ